MLLHGPHKDSLKHTHWFLSYSSAPVSSVVPASEFSPGSRTFPMLLALPEATRLSLPVAHTHAAPNSVPSACSPHSCCPHSCCPQFYALCLLPTLCCPAAFCLLATPLCLLLAHLLPSCCLYLPWGFLQVLWHGYPYGTPTWATVPGYIPRPLMLWPMHYGGGFL